MQSNEGSRPTRSQIVKRVLKAGGFGVLIVFVFGFGVGVGNGRVTFGSTADKRTDLPADLNYATVEQVYDTLKKTYDGKLDGEKLLDGIKGGLASATGDPYTEYFNPEEAKVFQDELDGSFTGIGAELGQDADKNLIIVAPIDGFPADKAGLRAQDIIIGIDGNSTVGMSVNEAVKKIRGEKGTKVTLKIVRNKSQDLTFTIVRDDIKIPSVKWEVLDGNIGYLKISQFSVDTVSLTERAAQEFKSKQVRGVVLDMRDDPGGLLSAAVEVSSLWLPEDKVVLREKRGGVTTKVYTANGHDLLRDMPTAVLINAGSASASEIVAGALKDNNAATLYGEKSYGKGSVQEIHQLPDGSEIKITAARWYRPNGQNIDKKGINPDKTLKMTEDDYKQNRDPQKDAAVQSLKAGQ